MNDFQDLRNLIAAPTAGRFPFTILQVFEISTSLKETSRVVKVRPQRMRFRRSFYRSENHCQPLSGVTLTLRRSGRLFLPLKETLRNLVSTSFGAAKN